MRKGNRRFLWWLAATTFIMAIAVAVLLAVVLAQSRSFEETARQRIDSVTALTFQLEREFMRLHEEMVTVARGDQVDAKRLSLRYDLFLSRVALLRENPTTEILRQRDEYRQVMPRLDQLIAQAEPVMAGPVPQPRRVAALLPQIEALGPDVQALSFAANSVVGGLLEQQVSTVREKNRLIIGLSVVQLILLLVAAASLAVRQHRQSLEAQALAALNVELQKARVAAETASRGKSLFLANMSHELRTPFNGFLGMLHMLEHTSPSPTQQDYIRTAKESAQHLLTLLNDILDVSSMEAGKLQLNLQPLDLPRALDEMMALMQVHAQGKGLELKLLRADDLPRWIQGDVTRFKQVLFNLMSNAIKFCERGSVTLAARIDTSDGAAPRLCVEVVDTGIGMNRTTLEHLFEHFYQQDMSVSRKFGGAGLGLQMASSLARLMQGELRASSEPGQGSTFTLLLPLVICPPPLARSNEAPSAQDADRKTLRILVAEDHPINQKFIGLVLKRMGHEGTFAENGKLALEYVQQQPFDIVLMDLHMPEMDGLSATRAIRALPGPLAHLPIIALTADVLTETRESAIAAGVDEFLTKPLQLSQLEMAIERCLQSARRRQALAT